MSFWSVMNWVAWGACAVITILLVKDVIAVETGRIAQPEQDATDQARPRSEG